MHKPEKRVANLLSRSTHQTPGESSEDGADVTGWELAEGQRLGKFEIREFLGQGGMGQVWRAYDVEGDVEVVIKILPPPLQGSKDALLQMKRSFQNVQPLQHQHLCPVYGLWADPRVGFYLVMKFVDGFNLSEYRDLYIESHSDLPLNVVLRVLMPVASALDYAHRQGVVHRDIKPENILILRDYSDIQVIDFGLAAEIRSSVSRLTGAEGTSGTYPYMAPEQWQGIRQDGRTDQYALAVVAYELLSGRMPFATTDPLVLRECVLTSPVPALEEQPAAVNGVLMRALAKDPNDRFANCKQFIQALAAAGGEKPDTTSQQGVDDSIRPDDAESAGSQAGLTTKAGRLMRQFARSAEVAAKIAAKQTERTRLATSGLPASFLALGQEVYVGQRWPEEFAEQYDRVTDLQNRLRILESKPSKVSRPTMLKQAEAAMASARDVVAISAVSSQLNAEFRKLGEAAFTEFGQYSGSPGLVNRITEQQQRIDVLAKEIEQLSESTRGQAITPLRLGIVAAVLIAAVALGWNKIFPPRDQPVATPTPSAPADVENPPPTELLSEPLEEETSDSPDDLEDGPETASEDAALAESESEPATEPEPEKPANFRSVHAIRPDERGALFALPAHRRIESGAFSKDGRRLAVYGIYEQTFVQAEVGTRGLVVYDVETRTSLVQLPTPSGSPFALSSDGVLVAAHLKLETGETPLVVVSVETGELVGEWDIRSSDHLRFSPDQSVLISVRSNQAHFCRLAMPEAGPQTLEIPFKANCFAVSADASILAVGSYDQVDQLPDEPEGSLNKGYRILFLNVSAGKPIGQIPELKNKPLQLELTAKPFRLVARFERETRIWDLAGGFDQPASMDELQGYAATVVPTLDGSSFWMFAVRTVTLNNLSTILIEARRADSPQEAPDRKTVRHALPAQLHIPLDHLNSVVYQSSLIDAIGMLYHPEKGFVGLMSNVKGVPRTWVFAEQLVRGPIDLIFDRVVSWRPDPVDDVLIVTRGGQIHKRTQSLATLRPASLKVLQPSLASTQEQQKDVPDLPPNVANVVKPAAPLKRTVKRLLFNESGEEITLLVDNPGGDFVGIYNAETYEFINGNIKRQLVTKFALAPNSIALAENNHLGGTTFYLSEQLNTKNPRKTELRRFSKEELSAMDLSKGDLLLTPDARGLAIWWENPLTSTVAFELWDLRMQAMTNKFRMIRTFKFESTDFTGVVRKQFTPSGRMLALGRADGRVDFFRLDKETRYPAAVEISRSVEDLAFSPDDKFLAVAGETGRLRVWELEDGKARLYRTFLGHDQQIERVQFSPDGQLIAATSSERDFIKTVTVWSMNEVRPRGIIIDVTPARSIAFHPKKPILAVGDVNGSVKFWDLKPLVALQDGGDL